jgi:uncharacterized protein (DUF305 family)
VGRDESGALVMRINRAITTTFIAIVALSLTACASTGTKGSMHNHSTQAAGDLSSDDVMFLQMMIPHHQQAIDISDLALTKSEDAELLALAKNIRDEQSAEIVKMKAWLEEANASSHSDSHSMDGMLSDSELAALDKASGKSFDVLWLKAMTGHHTGAIDMAAMIENAKSAEIKSFGEGIVASQSAQNKAMAAMIKRIG